MRSEKHLKQFTLKRPIMSSLYNDLKVSLCHTYYQLVQEKNSSIYIHSNFITTDCDGMYFYLLLYKDQLVCEAENIIYHNWLLLPVTIEATCNSSQFTVVVHTV